MAASPQRRTRWIAFSYAIVALAQVIVVAVLLQAAGWRLQWVVANLDITGGLLLGLLLAFLVNAALAVVAWNFLKMRLSFRIVVLIAASTLAACCVLFTAQNAWVWLDRSPAYGIGLGGSALLAIGYSLLAIALKRLLTSPQSDL